MLKKITPVFIFLLIFSCEKENISDNMIFGTWVSTDKADTLHISDNQTFKKSFHTFLYSRNIKKITIQYSGPNYILVSPTTHNYSLTYNMLKIDFTNGCYGFRSERITFIRLN